MSAHMIPRTDYILIFESGVVAVNAKGIRIVTAWEYTGPVDTQLYISRSRKEETELMEELE